ncbi:MAG: SpoIID/LytB domain-containing protein [Candidatus Moraniibacteriota bacterium]
MEIKKLKKRLFFLSFFVFNLVFLFGSQFLKVEATYSSEGIGFYAQTNSFGYTAEGIAFYTYTSQVDETLPVYRFVNSTSGDHFYTASENEKTAVLNNPQWGYTAEGIAFYVYTSQVNETLPVYRFVNSTSGDHFYTASENERNSLNNNPQWGYTGEGIAFYVFDTQLATTSPVYRFYAPSTGDHFYTASESEKNKLTLSPVYRFYAPSTGDHFYTASENEKSIVTNTSQSGYLPEGIAFYAYTTQFNGTVPVYRFYASSTGDHFYTTSESERDSLNNNPQWGYTAEGIEFYAYTTQADGTVPVYRFYAPSTGDHFYTASENEKNNLLLSELGPEIPVGLWNYGSRTALKDDPFKISANKAYNIKNRDGNIVAQIDGGTQTRVTYDSDSYLKAYGSVSETRSKNVFYFDAVDGDNSTLIFDVNRPSSTYDQYRGKIKIQYTDSANLWVINTLPLEHYAWGAGEFTGTGPAEHSKVMSTIFRTYGYQYISWTSTIYVPYGFRIKSDSGNQIYRGYDWETTYPNVKVAAQATRGVIATYNGDVALTPYSSWSDGRTRSFEERWGSKDYPWCRSVSDPYGKNSTMTTKQLEDAGNHMVGLIANGSLNLANNHNWDWQRIMKYYYTGISLNTAY